MIDTNNKINAKKVVNNVYCVNETNSSDIMIFLEDVISKRRGDSISDGLAASVVMFENQILASINKDDGFGPHPETQAELVSKYNELNGLDIDDNSCMEKLDLDGVDGRIIATSDEMILMFIAKNRDCSDFESNCLKEIARRCERLHNNGTKILYAFQSLSHSFQVIDWDVNSLSYINEEIDNMKKQSIKVL